MPPSALLEIVTLFVIYVCISLGRPNGRIMLACPQMDGLWPTVIHLLVGLNNWIINLCGGQDQPKKIHISPGLTLYVKIIIVFIRT